MATPAAKSTRRQFLAGEAARQAVEQALPGEFPATVSSSLPATPAADPLLQVGRAAMACDFDIFLHAGRQPGATEAALEGLDLIDRLESQLTVYRPTSEVMGLNRSACQGPVAVEGGLFQLLKRSVALWQLTGGAFDITSTPLVRLWGQAKSQGRIPTAEELAAALACVGSQRLELDESAATVHFHHPALEINLNAIGKGYALDRVKEHLLDRGVTDFLVHGGKSSILAHGDQGYGDGTKPGWLVTLNDPLVPTRHLLELTLHNRAVGTSGAGNQYFHCAGKRWGHVLDPRTGWPAEGVWSVTVLAPDAATADALATAFFVLGPEASGPLCAANPDLAAIFLGAGERNGEYRLVTYGLAEHDYRVLSRS